MDRRAHAQEEGGSRGGESAWSLWISLIAQVLAFWPVWRWLLSRWGDAAEEPWGLLALATAIIFLWVSPPTPRVTRAPLLLPAVLVLIYAAAYGWVPPLVRGAMALTALAATLSVLRFGRRLHPRLWGLMLLSLPLLPTLQFYAGYPLRAAAAQLAAPLLRFSGPVVLPEGACLRWAGGLIAIDAPCSGVKMLWTALFLALVLACFRCLTARGTGLAVLAAVLAAFAGNVIRSAALFYPEAGLVQFPPWAHAGIGIAVFLMVAAAIAWLAVHLPAEDAPAASPPAAPVWAGAPSSVHPLTRSRVRAGLPTEPAPGIQAEPTVRAGLPTEPARRLARHPFTRSPVHPLTSSSRGICLVACLAAGLVPLRGPVPAAGAAGEAFPGWPGEFEGRPLREVPRTERERRFERGFPGRIARFTDGDREIIIRWVTRPTRALHPAADCFRGLGYRVVLLPNRMDAQGRRWGCAAASKGAETLAIREGIRDAAGRTQSDVSAWYWAAALGRSAGPWWALTVAERR